MSSVDEPIHILNELQDYLSQFGVGDSIRGDGLASHGGYHVPISLVSYSPNGLTPRFGSAKNSPRLIKQQSSSALSSPRLIVDHGNKGDDYDNKDKENNNNNNVEREIINTLIVEKEGEKTTQFNREFFRSIDDSSNNVDNTLHRNAEGDSNNDIDNSNIVNGGQTDGTSNTQNKQSFSSSSIDLPVRMSDDDGGRVGEKSLLEGWEKTNCNDDPHTASFKVNRENNVLDEAMGKKRKMEKEKKQEEEEGDVEISFRTRANSNCSNLGLGKEDNTHSLVNDMHSDDRGGVSGNVGDHNEDGKVKVDADAISNLGPHIANATNNCDNLTSDGFVSGDGVDRLKGNNHSGSTDDRKEEDATKMGNSSGSQRKYSTSKRDSKGIHLNAWNHEENTHHYEEMRENVSVPSEDSNSNSYGLDVSIDNILYRSSGDSASSSVVPHSSRSNNGTGSSVVRATNSSDSGFSSPGVKKDDTVNSNKGLGRKKRSLVRLNSTFSDLESALAVPELIIDALGEDADCDDEDSPMPDSVPRITAFDATTLPIRKIDTHVYEDVEIVPNDRGDVISDSSTGSGSSSNKSAPTVTSPTADTSTHYPMIYRRSKNDPGDKQYKEVVRELSFVLEKRSADEQRQNIRDKLHLLDVHSQRKEEEEAQVVTRSSESVNVLGNKSLLMKLENHFRARGGTHNSDSSANTISNPLTLKGKNVESTQRENKELKVEITEQGKSSGNDYLGDRSSKTASGEITANSVALLQSAEAAKTYTRPDSTSPNFDNNMEELYSKPKKRILDTYGKRVSAKLIYDHHKQLSSPETVSANNSKDDYESIARDLNFVSEQNISVSDSDQDVSNGKIQNQELLDSNFIISGVRLDDKNVPSSSKAKPPTTFYYNTDSSHEVNKKPAVTKSNSEYVGHSLSWARSRVDTAANFRGTILTTSGSQKGDSSFVSESSIMGNAKKQQRRRANANSSLSNVKRHSLDDTLESNASSNGHMTTIGIEGVGLNRKSTIMYSEPDLTSIGSSNHYSRRKDKPVAEVNVPGGQLHNDSSHSLRDLSFSSSLMDETGIYFFDSNSFSSETSFDNRQQLVKVNFDPKHLENHRELSKGDSHGSNSSLDMDTYFITTRQRPPPSSSGYKSPTHAIVTGPRSHSVSMTTIVEHGDGTDHGPSSSSSSNRRTPSFRSVIDHHHGQRTFDNQHISVVRATSLRNESASQFHNKNSPSNVTRSQTVIHKSYSPNSNRLWRTGSSASASSSSSSSHNHNNINRFNHINKTTSTSTHDKNTLYVVVPHNQQHNALNGHPHNTSIPDLIVDHQLQTVTTTSTTTHPSLLHRKNHGSPFHQEIFEGALPSASGDGLHRGEEDKPASFIIDARRMHGEPTVQVDGPQSIAKCNMDHMPDGQYKVTYIPVEVGIFTAQVKWNGKDIPGSPFHPKIVNALKVRVIGGWQHYMDSQERVHLVVGEEKQIPFDTSEAGSGHMRAEVKSPSAFIPVTVDEEQKGKSVVKFVPQEEGNHYIHLYWCDHPLVNSPYLGYATSGVADPSKVILTGRGVKEGVVREEAEFIIDGSQAGPGEPDVQLIGVRAEIQVFTTPLGGGKYRCTYIPIIPGAYLLHISWNGRQLRGSPYKVNVIGASYPNRVVVNGEGLKGGLLGQNLDFRIDTRKAGPGELTAYCMGPTKVAYCELSDHHDGTYRLAVRAQEVGRHVLQIKYGGEHVQGSPFAFKVSAQPDASKVRVSGPGVEHGLLANFQSNFIVETKGAGAGQLTVRIRGPKGAFQVEMYRESHKDRTILCRYYPTVTGLYIINVRWSGVDVPGSPFHVNILDTHQELEHVLRDQGFTPNGHQSSFNSSSSGLINHHQSRVAYHQHHHSQNHAHNTSRSSGYYAWRGDD